MERKIGEIFEFGGEWYQCVKGMFCNFCAFESSSCPKVYAKGRCNAKLRDDETDVIFKKLEKVGEPHFIKDEIFEGGKVYVQNFKVNEDFEGHKPICNDYIIYDWKNRIISIEIKKTKEDMEEKKFNLKPFNLEAAKAGKPVCTRDGRKARIICFDKAGVYPIIALVQEEGMETCHFYAKDGKCVDYKHKYDLMMLPEKKEGWVNIYALNTCYSSKEEAEANIDQDYEHEYVRTVKIEWEE